MKARPDGFDIIFVIVILIVAMILIAMAITPVRAESINPDDIRIESNGMYFQYGDRIDITIYGENNTTYRFFIEDKGYLLRMYYMPIWCNWSGIGRASWIINDTLLPRWHTAYIKLTNVTSNNPSIEFKVEYTDEQLLFGFQETSGEMKETDKDEGFWNDVRITSVLIILVLVNIAVLWKKILPIKIRLGEPIYDKKLGVMVRPFREYTKLERSLIFIANTLSYTHLKHKIKRKMVKTPYTYNIETNINPPEKMKQKLDANKKYLTILETENIALLKSISVEKAKLEELRDAPDVERDVQAIHIKENDLIELRKHRAKVGLKMQETTKTIHSQEAELKKLFEEEKKGVFVQ